VTDVMKNINREISNKGIYTSLFHFFILKFSQCFIIIAFYFVRKFILKVIVYEFR